MDYSNKGAYTLGEAAHLLRKPTRWVQRVVHGYSTVHQGRRPTEMPPVFFRDYDRELLSFLDLIELAFVRDFRDAGFSLQVIRKAASLARELWREENHPFCLRRFETDGKSIFFTAVKEDGTRQMIDLFRRQHVFEQVVRPFVRQLEYSEAGRLLRWYPLGKRRSVVLDPKLNFGRPYIVTRGVTVEAVIAANDAGDDAKTIGFFYELSPKQVRDALDFAQEYRQAA